MILTPKQVEALIAKSIEKGEFDNLKGMGLPLDLNFKNNAETDLLQRMGVVPREVSLMKELTSLPNGDFYLKRKTEIEVELDVLRELRKRLD